MNLDEILSDLADALELERELGVREVEIDRSLLKGETPVDAVSHPPVDAVSHPPVDAVSHRVNQGTGLSSSDAEGIPRLRDAEGIPRLRDAEGIPRLRDADGIPRLRDAERLCVYGDAERPPRLRDELPLVFLHDRALSAGGVEMMAKIVTAMHQTPETAPILFMGPRPAARVTVVLGFRALKHWFPNVSGAPGQWIEPDGLKNVLVTYSPEHILRFGAQSLAVKKLKLEMWTSLKAAMQRLC